MHPYPATLNRWPTVLRVDSLPISTGYCLSCLRFHDGVGVPANPAIGDWRILSWTKTIYPESGILPKCIFKISDGSLRRSENCILLQWPLPSHPAAGGGPTAGAVGQLQELPQDMPLYTNQARAAYLVKCDVGLSTIYESLCGRPWSRRKYRL